MQSLIFFHFELIFQHVFEHSVFLLNPLKQYFADVIRNPCRYRCQRNAYENDFFSQITLFCRNPAG